MIDLGLLGAFLGGALTILSPCSVMLLPAFFAYAFSSPRELVARTGVFYLGLITTLVPLGILAGTVGVFVAEHRETLVRVGAALVVLLGLLMLLGRGFTRGMATSSASPTGSAASVYVLGTVYGLGGGCSGPLFGSVLTVAAMGANAFYGGLLLLVFAAGMVLPLLILALLWNRLPGIKRLVRPREVVIGRWRTTWTQLIGGAVTVAIGLWILLNPEFTAPGSVLGASDQVRVESWVLRTSAQIPNVAVAAVAVAVLLAVSGAWAAKRRRARRPVAAAHGRTPDASAHPAQHRDEA